MRKGKIDFSKTVINFTDNFKSLISRMMHPEINERPSASTILHDYVPTENILEIRRQKVTIKIMEKQIKEYEKIIESQKTSKMVRRKSMYNF